MKAKEWVLGYVSLTLSQIYFQVVTIWIFENKLIGKRVDGRELESLILLFSHELTIKIW